MILKEIIQQATVAIYLICLYLAIKFQLIEILPVELFNKSPVSVIEITRPGFLSNFPVNASPIPGNIWHRAAYTRKPSGDLITMGIAPDKGEGVQLDRRQYPSGRVLKYDDLGFPNITVPGHADTLIIGDSFAWIAGHYKPASLSQWLEQRLPGNLYNMAESGTGTLKQAWLLENLGWSFKPKRILWFYYAGNDLMEDNQVIQWEENGLLGIDEIKYIKKGRYEYTPDKVMWQMYSYDPTRNSESHECVARFPHAKPVPGFKVLLSNGKSIPMWLYHFQIQNVMMDRKAILDIPSWSRVTQALKSASDTAKRRGCRLIFIYIPSKEQVYLPLIEPDLALFHRFMTMPREHIPNGSKIGRKISDGMFYKALKERHTLENMLAEFCQKEDIAWFSTTSHLEAAAAEGPDPVFLTSDTHWNMTGQKVILEPLMDFITSIKS